MDEDFLNNIVEAIKEGSCLAFLGAGACTAFVNKEGVEVPGLPTGSELARLLAERFGYRNGQEEKTAKDEKTSIDQQKETAEQKKSMHTYDLLKVAEYIARKDNGRTKLEKAIQDLIQVGCPPRPIHKVLAQLNEIKFVITSNYDTLIERAMQDHGRILTRDVYDHTDPKTAHFQGPILGIGERDVVLHKMHGTIEEPKTIIITESDYIRYLAYLTDRDRGMPEYFRTTIIPPSTLLFLGYGLEDWNFRVIWEGVLAQHNSRRGYALMKNPPQSLARYWSKKNVDIIDQDLTEFAHTLAKIFDLKPDDDADPSSESHP